MKNSFFVMFWVSALILWPANTTRPFAQEKKKLPEAASGTESASKRLPKWTGSDPKWRVDWSLLWLGKERFIKKVRVKLYRYNAVFVESGPPIVDIEVDSDSPLVIKNFTEGLTNALMFTPQQIADAGVGSMPTGELEVITNKDFFKIYFDLKFILNEEHWAPDNSFMSWTLAKSIDDLLAEKAARHLSPDQFERLSGERWLKAERENYAKRVKEAKGN